MACELKVEPNMNAVFFDPNDRNDYGENVVDEVGGQYFMDQATGQCYYQTSNGEIMLIALEEEGELDAKVPIVLNSQETPGKIEACNKTEIPNSNQVMPTSSTNNNGNIYQTVTIVPTDTGKGDVNSYVLVVQEPEQSESEKKTGPVGIITRDGDDPTDDYDFEKDTDAYLDATLKKSKKNIDSVFPCKNCNYTSTKAFLLTRHMRSHSDVRPHRCAVCDRGFKSLPCLQNHVNTHTGTKPFKCKFCSHRFTTSGELVRHVRYKHTFEKPHKCTECGYASVELSKLKRHIRIHTGERPFECNQCTYASPDTFKLKRHMRIHTGDRPYHCDLCPSAFTQSNSLKSHRQIHTNSKPIFQCQLCPTTCGRKTDLRLHIQKQHTSVETVHCKICGQGFPERYTLKVHKKLHNGQKCFTCELCPYASTSQRHLESHMLLHTDQKPFQCDACDQAFRQRQLLRRHQNIRHNPGYVPPEPKVKEHVCSDCGKSFRHKGNLARHEILHDPEATIQDKSEALKVARKKKIQVNPGNLKQPAKNGIPRENDANYFEADNLFGSTGNGNQSFQNSLPNRDTKFDQNEEYSSAITMQDENGQQYLVLEVMSEPDENNPPGTGQNNLENIPALNSIQQNGNTFSTVSMADFLPLHQDTSSGNLDGIQNMNSTVVPINSNTGFTDYKTLGVKEEQHLLNFNQPVKFLPSFHTPAYVTNTGGYCQPKLAGPSRFVRKDELELNSASASRKRDLATSFGFDSDEE